MWGEGQVGMRPFGEGGGGADLVCGWGREGLGGFCVGEGGGRGLLGRAGGERGRHSQPREITLPFLPMCGVHGLDDKWGL